MGRASRPLATAAAGSCFSMSCASLVGDGGAAPATPVSLRRSFQLHLPFFFFPPAAGAAAGGAGAGFSFSAVRLTSEAVVEGDATAVPMEPAVRMEGFAEAVVRARQTSFMSFSSKSAQRGTMVSMSSDQATRTRSSR
jgi:hypothetical protein